MPSNIRQASLSTGYSGFKIARWLYAQTEKVKMSIQKDAGELLEYVYERYTKGENMIKPDGLIKETRWEAHRINNARTYLSDRDLIKIAKQSGNVEGVANYIITGLTPSGIDMIENEKKFKTTFGFEIGPPGLKFSWKREK